MEFLFPFIGLALGGLLAVVMFKNKRKREDERMKEVIKQAINETTDNK